MLASGSYGREFRDDTMWTGGAMRNLGTINLPGIAQSAPQARAFVRKAVPGLDDETLADIALCVDELVANACEHTASGRGGRVMVAVGESGGTVRITVTDDGGAAGKPCVRDEPTCEDGRGLRLVEALSTGWGSHGAARGTAVWADFRRPSAPPPPAPGRER